MTVASFHIGSACASMGEEDIFLKKILKPKRVHTCSLCNESILFNDRFNLSFFVATHGFRISDFDYYSISHSSAHKSRPSVSMCVY